MNSVTVGLVIDPEFQALIPPLSAEERAQLEANIERDGCRDPLVAWAGQGILLDGHNRYEICERSELPYRVDTLAFDSRDDAKVWVIQNQFGRRNLEPFVRSELALALKPLIAARAKARQGARADLRPDIVEKSPQSESARTREQLASLAGVSDNTIAKVERIKAHAQPEITDAARRGTLSVNMASQLAELPVEAQLEVAVAPVEEQREVARDVLKRAHVANNSGNNEWYTPAEFVEAARWVLGAIDLDPASCEAANQVVQAERIYTAEDDGLTQPWAGRVWMNPPYASALIGSFIDKLAESAESGAIDEAVVLVNNATETQWFQRLASCATALCFPKGRVRFWSPDRESATPLQGQAVAYVGPDPARFCRSFDAFGLCVEVRRG